MDARIPVPEDETSLWKRVAISTAGGTLVTLGLRRRSWAGYAAALAGGWMLYRGIRGEGSRRVELAPVDGLESSAQALDVQRTLAIDAPADEVQAFLAEPANLDTVLGEAGTVQAAGDAGQRWTLATSFGDGLSWEMLRLEDEDVQGWASADGAPLDVQIATKPRSGEDRADLSLHVGVGSSGAAAGGAGLQRLAVAPPALASRMVHGVRSLVETGELPQLVGSASAREAPPPDL